MGGRSAPASLAVIKHADGPCRNRTTTLALDYINAFLEEKQRLARRGQVLPLFQLCSLMLSMFAGCMNHPQWVGLTTESPHACL